MERSAEKLRILHVVHSADPAGGGVIEAITQIALANCEDGHAIELASLDAPNASYLRDLRVPVHALGCGSRYGYSRKFNCWITNQHSRFDAVIVNGLWQYSSFGVWRALRRAHTPYFVFSHGMLDPWFRRAFPLKHLKKLAYWHVAEHRVLRDARAVLFTCEEERRLAPKSFGPIECNSQIVHLGTAPPESDEEQQRETFYSQFPHLRDKRIILFLGRLHPKKAPDLLICALVQALKNVCAGEGNGAQSVHLVFAGPCPDDRYLNKLNALAKRHLLPGQVTFTGMLRGDVKWGALRAADVFVLPSHQENFGLAVTEALAVGLPVLISNKVNIWREIQQDEAGLVDSDDLPGTTRLLTKWLSMNDAQRHGLRGSARACFISRFEIRQAADKFARFLVSTAKEQSRVALGSK